jgi:hypothetical protein
LALVTACVFLIDIQRLYDPSAATQGNVRDAGLDHSGSGPSRR